MRVSPTLRVLLRAWPLLLLAAIVAYLAACLVPMLRAGEPDGGDLSAHLAEIGHLTRALKAGDFALWNPEANLGYASGYYYQLLPQLVPAVSYLALGGAVSLLLLFKLSIIVPIALLPATSYRALRVLRASPGIALGGAAGAAFVLGSSVWGNNTDSVLRTGLYTQPWAMLFFPLAVAYCARYLCVGAFLGRAVLYSVLTGLCHPFLGVCIVPAMALAPWWRSRPRFLLRRGALLTGLVLASTAFLWLPILVHYDAFGGFPNRHISEAGIPAADFVRVLRSGNLLDNGRLPILTVTLLPALFIAVRQRGLHLALLGGGFMMSAFVVLGPALGDVGDDLVPCVRFLAVAQLALALAGGAALARLVIDAVPVLRAGPSAGRRIACINALLLTMVIGVAVVCLAAGTMRELERRIRTSDDNGGFRRSLGQVMDHLEELPRGRLLAGAAAGTGGHWNAHLPSVYAGKPALTARGGAALQSSPNYRYLRDRRWSAHWRLFGVRYLLVNADDQKHVAEAARHGGNMVFQSGPYALIELPDWGLFEPIQLAGALSAERPARYAAVASWLDGFAWGDPIPRLGGSDEPTPLPQAQVLERWEGESLYGARVLVDGAACAFVLKVSYHPGWSVTVDGEPGRVVRVAPDIMAVTVPRGAHTITFRFRRPLWSWLLLTLAGAIALCLLLRPWLGKWRRSSIYRKE